MTAQSKMTIEITPQDLGGVTIEVLLDGERVDKIRLSERVLNELRVYLTKESAE